LLGLIYHFIQDELEFGSSFLYDELIESNKNKGEIHDVADSRYSGNRFDFHESGFI